jgi:major membrane immunogen (membrane-anchored lipoprotein)
MMKKTALAMSMAAMITVTGCGSLGFGSKEQALTPPSDSQTAVRDGTISTEFKDEGIKLFYTFTGKLDRIEVYGLAPAWKGNVDVLAEADAMDKLVKFVHGQTVSTDRRVKIMAKSLDKARDNTLNRFKSNDDNLNFDSKELENSGSENTSNNTSRRIADRVENTLVNTVTTITAKGRLTGVRKVRDSVVQDGKMYVAVYQWSEKDQATSEFIRGRMR